MKNLFKISILVSLVSILLSNSENFSDIERIKVDVVNQLKESIDKVLLEQDSSESLIWESERLYNTVLGSDVVYEIIFRYYIVTEDKIELVKKLSYYPENLQLKSKELYVDGLKNGQWISYDKSGKIIRKESYLNNLKHGEWITRGKQNYFVGHKHGLYQEYWNELNIKEECNYKLSKKDGLCTTYWNSGGIKEKGHYIEDIKDGVWSWFSEGGQEIEYVFEKGKKISRTNKY